jgi:hypothetical protein
MLVKITSKNLNKLSYHQNDIYNRIFSKVIYPDSFDTISCLFRKWNPVTENTIVQTEPDFWGIHHYEQVRITSNDNLLLLGKPLVKLDYFKDDINTEIYCAICIFGTDHILVPAIMLDPEKEEAL